MVSSQRALNPVCISTAWRACLACKGGSLPVAAVQKAGLGPRYPYFMEMLQVALPQVDQGGPGPTPRNSLESSPGAEAWRPGFEVSVSLD